MRLIDADALIERLEEERKKSNWERQSVTDVIMLAPTIDAVPKAKTSIDDLKIGDEVFVHGRIDEMRTDTVIIRNEGGYFGTIYEELLEFDEVDAVPKHQLSEETSTLRHGKWEKSSGQRYKEHARYMYRCSLCNELVCGESNYCPNCGAKMEGKNNED